jgi:uncharacterized tellurite resistance protein B-like protein
MLRALKRIFDPAQADTPAVPAHERRHLQVAVAILLHEARRSDYTEGDAESDIAILALAEIFGVEPEVCTALLEEGRAKGEQLTSFYAPLTVIKREFSMEERILLIEHLWRVTFADGQLNLYEDHYVRKIAHLLHVPNTQSMLARNRARS